MNSPWLLASMPRASTSHKGWVLLRFIAIPVFLSTLVSCTRHQLVVTLNGRPAQSMEARIDRVDGSRVIDLALPGGLWAVSTQEAGLTTRLVEIDGLQHVRINLPADRMVSSRPILLTLQGLDRNGKPSGDPYTVSLGYLNRQQKASPHT